MPFRSPARRTSTLRTDCANYQIYLDPVCFHAPSVTCNAAQGGRARLSRLRRRVAFEPERLAKYLRYHVSRNALKSLMSGSVT
ncbi:hypothetical protein RD1_3187 [Roseobacter denitrificans OCh 114]|uniref:Uncharacterized protein n=1 Tax=Roseobacter denitrificans (strain ATCC 33942 / OCh 114) TaxID=375451 RepID=Q164A1_ROSDO|nr:hypothetical protein RD1_3187 [Roseobacter denitrificans OCh 114]